jgi:hypothetical protein
VVQGRNEHDVLERILEIMYRQWALHPELVVDR